MEDELAERRLAAGYRQIRGGEPIEGSLIFTLPAVKDPSELRGTVLRELSYALKLKTKPAVIILRLPGNGDLHFTGYGEDKELMWRTPGTDAEGNPLLVLMIKHTGEILEVL